MGKCNYKNICPVPYFKNQIASLKKKLTFIEEKFEDLVDIHARIIYHATDGKMSKPYTDVSMVEAMIDDTINEKIEDVIKEKLKNKEREQNEINI